jgi:hypothetical protein
VATGEVERKGKIRNQRKKLSRTASKINRMHVMIPIKYLSKTKCAVFILKYKF